MGESGEGIDCGEGYELKNKICNHIFFYLCYTFIKLFLFVTGVKITCSKGLEWVDGTCVKITHKECQNGFEWKNGQCVKIEKKNCNDGFEMKNGVCTLIKCELDFRWKDGHCNFYFYYILLYSIISSLLFRNVILL